MKKLIDIEILKKYIYKKKINIISPNTKYLKENIKELPQSDLNILVNFHNKDIELIKELLEENFILFHSTVSIEDNFLPEDLCINQEYFENLKKFKCKHLISIGSKLYKKEHHLKEYLNIFENISLVPLKDIYKYESMLKFLPNSLIITLLQVIKFKPEKINLFGFDLHCLPTNISNKSHYNKIENTKFLSSIFITSDDHNYFHTLKFLKKLYLEKKIEVDDNLKVILEFTCKKNYIDFKLENKNDLSNLLKNLEKIKKLDDLVKYNLDLSQNFINDKESINILNKLNTFNKLDKFIKIEYNQNINYFNSNLNIDLFDKNKIFNDKKEKIITPPVPNRSILKNIFKFINHWDTLFKFKLEIEKRLILFKINFDINILSEGVLLRIFKNSKNYIEIPLLKGSNVNEYFLENNCGEIKFEIINAPLSNKAFWKVKLFQIEYVVC